MKIIAFQKVGGKAIPFTEDDIEDWSNFRENQVVKAKVVGFQKQRSIHQLGLLMACIKEVVDNTEDENWNSKDRAKLSLKAMLNYVDSSATVVYKNRVVVKYRSFSFNELPRMEANKIFDRAFPILASVIGVTADELIQAAQENMQR